MHKLPEGTRKLVRDLAWRRLRKPVERPLLSDFTRLVLKDVLRPEVDDLRALTDLPLATWSMWPNEVRSDAGAA